MYIFPVKLPNEEEKMIDDNDDDDEYEWVVPDGGKILLKIYMTTSNIESNFFSLLKDGVGLCYLVLCWLIF